MKHILLTFAIWTGLFLAGAQAQVTLLDENFEGNTLPLGWTTIDADGDGHQWEHTSVQNLFYQTHSGEGAAVSYAKLNGAAFTPDDWLVSPPITLVGNSTLSFWRMVAWNNFNHYGVYISTTSGTDPSAFTLLYEETPVSSSYGWTERTVNLDAYTGSTVYIAFRHFNCTNLLGIAIDDVVLTCSSTAPIITANPNMLQFPNVPVGQSSASQLVTVEGYNITGDITASVAAPFEISLDDTNFTSNVTLPLANQVLHVRYSPTYEGSDSVVMTLTDGTTSTNVTLLGNGIDCSSITLPYGVDFDDLLEYDLPNCWSRINPFEGTPMATNSFSSANMVLKFESDYIDDQPVLAVLPLMPDFLTDLQVSFTTMHENYSSGTFSVGYLSDPDDGSTFVPVWSVIPSQISAMEFHPFLVSFENAIIDPSQDYYIAFQYFSTSSSLWYLNDVVVDVIPACPPPYDLNVVTVTSSTATITWNGSASLFNIYYKPTSENTWSTIENVVIDPLGYTIENLLSSTDYEWYVASVCDGDSVVASLATSTFSTPCSPYSTPFEEDFDANASLPLCWGRYNGWASDIFAGEELIPTTAGWNFNMNTYIFGANHARVNIFGSSCNRWLVTPAIDLSELANPVLVFDLALTAYNSASPIANPSAQADDKFMVIVSTDFGHTWSAANATVWSNDSSGDYVFNQIPAVGQEVTISLSDYANEVVMIAFYAESTISGNGDNDLHLDNVMVNFATNCAKPTNLAVQNVTDNSVTLSWTENGSATSWDIEYGPAGFQHGSVDATMVTANTNPFTLSNLDPNAYDFYVRSDCGSEVSYWSNVVNATPGVYTMGITGSDTLTTCSMMICDDGGATGDYSSACDYMLVLYPGTPGESVGVVGSYHTESNDDRLFIYDGVGINGTVLGDFSGNGEVPVLVASNGPLTIRFLSDNGLEYGGFALNTFCTSCMPPIGLTVSNVGPHTAHLSWNGSADTYMVDYKAVGDTAWNHGNTVDTAFNLVGLVESTTYLVNVYSACTDGQSLAASLTFTTTMVPTAIPYSTDFAAGSDQIWLTNNGNCTNRWKIGSVDGNANGLFITANGNSPGYNTSSRSVVSAEKLFTVGDAEELAISFDVKVGGEADFDYLKVFFAPSEANYPSANTGTFPNYSDESYSTNAVNFSNFMLHSAYTSYPYKFNLTGNNTVQVSVVMPNPNVAPTAASTAKLVFVWRNDQTGGTQPGAVIYNVSVEEVTCPAPSGLAVSNITSNGAHVAWTVNGDETSWTVEYKGAGDSTWTSVPVSGTPSCNLTGLTVGTAYQLRVQANCDVDDNSLWVSTEFYTPCDAITTFPFTEGFENGSMPDCWSQEHVFGLVDWSFQAGDHPNDSINAAHGGSYNAYFYVNSDAGNTTRLVSPVLDLSQMSNPYLTYWFAQKKWGGNQDHLTILYRTSPTSDWQILLPHGQSFDVWTKDSIALPTPTATYQIAFSGEANHGYGIVLDDITINGEVDTTVVPEPCEAPTNLQQIIYTKETGSIILSWTDNAGVSEWNLQYRPLNGQWTTVVVTGTPNYTINGLVNGDVYEIRVQAVCNGGVVSEWSSILTATAINSGIENWLENSVTLYPNPACEYVDIRIDGDVNVTVMEVYDVYGKLINTVAVVDNPTRINVNGLADGMYFVRVTTEEGVVTKTFVKK